MLDAALTTEWVPQITMTHQTELAAALMASVHECSL